MIEGSHPTTAMARMRARAFKPKSLARDSLIISIAEAPSDKAEELPAVTVPFTGSNAGRNAANCLEASPDFVKLAEAYGAYGYRIERREELSVALKEAFAAEGPAFIDVRVDPSENVYPMVPAGSALGDMMLA